MNCFKKKKKSVLEGHWGRLTRLYSHDGPPGFLHGQLLKYLKFLIFLQFPSRTQVALPINAQPLC